MAMQDISAQLTQGLSVVRSRLAELSKQSGLNDLAGKAAEKVRSYDIPGKVNQFVAGAKSYIGSAHASVREYDVPGKAESLAQAAKEKANALWTAAMDKVAGLNDQYQVTHTVQLRAGQVRNLTSGAFTSATGHIKAFVDAFRPLPKQE